MILIEEKNKYEFDDLFNCVIETEDKFLNKKLNSNICFGKGGGGGQKQQDIAPTLRPFVTDVLERAKAEFTQDELAQFPGERVVGFSDDELAAQEGILGLVDRGISSDKRLSSADTYYDPALGLLKKSGRYTDKGASEITADEIQSRMNPYTQAVLDIAKRKAADEGALYKQQLASQAARTGGFGGSRQAILEAKAASDLGGRLSEIQTKGMEAAYNDAIRAAEAQRGRQFQAASGLGALSGQFGNLGQQALGQAYREQGYRSGVGEAQRGLEQQRADVAYQTFVEGRDFPARQLERYAGIAFGVPQGYLQQPGPAGPSGFQQFVGGATTVGGLGRGLGFFNQGGNIGSGGLSTVYRNTAGSVRPGTLDFTRGEIADLQRQYEAETDPEKKEDLRRKLLIKGGEQLQSTNMGRRFADPDVMNPADFFSILMANQPDDTGLERAGKFAGRTALAIPGGIIDLYKGAVGATRSGREYLTTPLDELEQQKAIKEEQYEAYEKAQAEAAAAEEAAKNPEEAGGADFAALLSKISDLNNRTESVEELRKLTQEAFKFDKDKREKSIKAQQGFDIAALGMQLMSKPLSEIDPKYVGQLGVSRKELDNLDQEEAMSLYKAKVAELGLSKTIAEIQNEQAGFVADLGDVSKLSSELGAILGTTKGAQEASRILQETKGMSETEAQRHILDELQDIVKNPKAYLNPKDDSADDKIKAQKRDLN